jgi:hypothetical protein
MKIKILVGSVLLILILGLAAGAFWWLHRPQIITFDTGEKLTLLGVDYGKRHVPPGTKAPATLVTNTLPRARTRGGAFTTANDMLVVWVRQEHDPRQYANFQYYLYDTANTACVGLSSMNYGGRQQSNEVVGIQFPAFPRRQGKFVVRVQKYGQEGPEFSDQKFIIRNPTHGSFSEWTPEALPDTKDDGDFSATLTKLVFGADANVNRDQDDSDDPVNKGVEATFNVSQNGKPVTNWQPVSIETTDATGNHTTGWVNQNQWQGNDDVVSYQFGLWSDEPAWKLRVEFSEISGYSDSEVWSVTSIPLEPGRQQDFWNYNYNNRRNGNTNTNTPFAETDINGIHLKVYPAKQFMDVPPNSQPSGGLTIEASPALPEGMRLTLVSLTDDQTNDIGNWNSGTYGGGNSTTYRYGLRDLGGATNLNLTIAVHPSHFIEFTAKPEKTAAASAQ